MASDGTDPLLTAQFLNICAVISSWRTTGAEPLRLANPWNIFKTNVIINSFMKIKKI